MDLPKTRKIPTIISLCSFKIFCKIPEARPRGPLSILYPTSGLKLIYQSNIRSDDLKNNLWSVKLYNLQAKRTRSKFPTLKNNSKEKILKLKIGSILWRNHKAQGKN